MTTKTKIAIAEPHIPVRAFDDQRELQVAALLNCTEHHPPERILVCVNGDAGLFDADGEPARFEMALTPEACTQLEYQLRGCRELVAGGEFDLVELARDMFNAYNERGGWKTFDGRPVPKWEDLGDEVQARWVAAAGATRPKIEFEMVADGGVPR